MKILPLTGGVGAEILDIDLSEPQEVSTWDSLRQAFVDHGVIFFRDQDLTPARQLHFAAQFGTVTSTPNVPTLDGHAELTEIRKEPDQHHNIGSAWHSDQSARRHPVRGTLLLAREVPDVGGDTCFISVASAYDALSEELKLTLETLKAVHSDEEATRGYLASLKSDGKDYDAGALVIEEAVHPVVIRLPENGRRALYVNPSRTVRFEGWSEAESRDFLKFLFQHCQRPEFLCRFRWRPGSMAFWDNYQTWHYAVNDYHGRRRVMHRTTIVSALFD